MPQPESENADRPVVLVAGASGYVGGRLIPLLEKQPVVLRCLARNPDKLRPLVGTSTQVVRGDVLDPGSLDGALQGVHTAYYLVHLMSGSKDFEKEDRQAATNFAQAATKAGVRRIVYLGGLGDDADPKLSPHLRSRHEVGRELHAGGVAVTEFRAAIIVGSGSVSFEMLRYLTERLPLMIAPKWVRTRCQPIGVRDVIAYLVAALDQPASAGRIIEIGGADVLQYQEMMLRYAAIRNLKRRIVIVPYFSPRLSSRWIHLVTPIPASIAQPLVEGLFNEVVVRDDAARTLFPMILPIGYDAAVRRALDRNASTGPATTWFDAFDVKTLPGEFAGTTQGMLIDRREQTTSASQRDVFRVFSSLGGAKGWLYADWLWALRGVLDRLVGGIGTRRGRRSPDSLRVGDAVDFWRVEAYRPPTLLRLRAEMKLPGYAWLEFEAVAQQDGSTSLLQTAFFDPRGIFGFLYWYAVLPFHGFIFRNMAARIVREAEAAAAPAPAATAMV